MQSTRHILIIDERLLLENKPNIHKFNVFDNEKCARELCNNGFQDEKSVFCEIDNKAYQ